MKAISVQCTVQSHRFLTPTVFELTFDTDLPIEFKGGQFVSVIVPGAGPGGRDLRRAYSIASSPEARPFELCVKLVEGGPGTNYLNGLRPGDVFKGMFPYGDFTHKEKPDHGVCFISTGTGIAPFRSIVLSEAFQKNPPTHSTLLLGVREENEVLYDAELKALTGKIKNFNWETCVSRPTRDDHGCSFRGRVTDYLRSLPVDYPFTKTDYYLCGGGAMIDEVKKILMDKGVEKTSIHQEVYYKEPK